MLPQRMLLAHLTRVILPEGDQNRNNISHKLLCLLFCMMFNHPFNFHHLMINHMIHASRMTRKHALPYANWLTLVFEHFGVDFEGEEKVNSPIPFMNEDTMANLGMYKLRNGNWVSDETMTHSERTEVN